MNSTLKLIWAGPASTAQTIFKAQPNCLGFLLRHPHANAAHQLLLTVADPEPRLRQPLPGLSPLTLLLPLGLC